MYSETHQIINDMADVKMAMNSHKGKIEDCSPQSIIEMLRGEVDELEQAIKEGDDMMHIIEESADCLNFLVAITHQQIAKYRSRK